MEKKAYKPEEVKTMLGIGTNSVYELMKRKDFPAFKIGANWIIPCEEFNKWLYNQCNNR